MMTVKQLEEGHAEVENQYARAVHRKGNRPAQELIHKVFKVSDRQWRGIGIIPKSGYRLRDEFASFDAENEFDVTAIQTQESPLCIAGQVMQGLKKPRDCSAFGIQCTPEHPLGAPMVSSEGACAAYFHYGKIRH
jgi:hydrogenase expression/formation protein HypD